MSDKSKQINFRPPDLTRQQIDAIQAATGLTQTQIIVLAISRLYEQLEDITPKSQKPR